MSLLCIYCRHAPVGSKEHILQSGLGSTWLSKNIVCSDCNNSFSRGDKIDDELVAGFQSLRSQLWIFDGRNNPPPRLRRHATDPEGHLLDLLPGGRFAPSQSTTQKDGDQITMTFGSATSAAARIPNIRGQFPVDPAKFTLTRTVGPNILATQGSWSSNEAGRRGIAKACFNFLGEVAPNVARDEMFDALRQHVRDCNYSSPVGTYLDMTSPLPSDVEIPEHALFISSESARPALIAQVVLFGVFQFLVLLCENYSGRPVNESVIIDPWERSVQRSSTHQHQAILDLPKVLNMHLEAQGTQIELAVKRVEQLTWQVKAWTDRNVAIIRALQAVGLREGDSIPPAAAAPLGSELANTLFGLPTKQVVGSSEEAVRREAELEKMLVSSARKAPWRGDHTAHATTPKVTRQAPGERAQPARFMGLELDVS